MRLDETIEEIEAFMAREPAHGSSDRPAWELEREAMRAKYPASLVTDLANGMLGRLPPVFTKAPSDLQRVWVEPIFTKSEFVRAVTTLIRGGSVVISTIDGSVTIAPGDVGLPVERPTQSFGGWMSNMVYRIEDDGTCSVGRLPSRGPVSDLDDPAIEWIKLSKADSAWLIDGIRREIAGRS